MFADINILAVFVAAVVAMIIGMFWYSPGVFGSVWMESAGLKKSDLKDADMMKSMVFGFITNVVMAFVLAKFILVAGGVGAAGGAEVAFWIWLGFMATVQLGAVLWEMKPFSYYVVNTGHTLGGMLAMGAIIGSWV